MTNPDNVGGLPELPELPRRCYEWHGDELWTAGAVRRYARAYGELCRAAPAGGDCPECRGTGGTHWLREDNSWDGERCDTCDGTGRSAPAGSGEVADKAAWLERAAAKWEVGPMAINPADALRLRELAALLRKLQQPAEEDAYVIEQMGRLLAEIAIIVNGPEPALTKWSYHDLPEKVRKLQQGAE